MSTPALPPILSSPLRLLIDGQWTTASSDETFEVINPSTGTPLAREALGNAQDIDRAVQAARRAFEAGPWARMRPADRTRLMLKLAQLIEDHGDELALLETLNTGKPLMIARKFDVGLAAECLRYNAGWATKLHGETRTSSLPGDWHTYTLREPIGVVGLIVPWNVPLAMAVNKIAPALAAGCTAVLKPAELTPLTALRLGELALEAGLPPGVLNIVTGLGSVAGQALVEHPDVDKVSFTGSTAVGKALLSAAAGNLKRVSLELGGKSPVFIFPDADLDRAIESAARGIFGNTGQVCAAGSRLFVHRDVADRVVEGIAARARALKVAPGLEAGAEIGPVISQRQRERVMSYIESGLSEGARVVAGGGAVQGPGYFIEPTVMVDTRPEMRLVREEIFGPVLCVQTFDHDSLEQLAARGNDTEYGLSSAIWTRDLRTAHQMARRLKAGNVRVNAAAALDFAMPFGGYKQSGWGRENGREGVEAFTELKSVAIDLN